MDELQKLPGIGPKSAQRLAFHILGTSHKDVLDLAQAIKVAKETIRHCSRCYTMTDVDPCTICDDQSRQTSQLCVVAEPKDLLAVERSREFTGRYHVLGGMLSPLDGFGPENLRIKELLERLQTEDFSEIILAISPTTEGEATTIYLTKLLRPLGVKTTRLAYGLPIGSDMDYADEATMSKAMSGRREL